MNVRKLGSIGKSISFDGLRQSAARWTKSHEFSEEEPQQPLEAGTVVTFRDVGVQIVEPIASGAYAQVFRCVDARGHEYALKCSRCRSIESLCAARREVDVGLGCVVALHCCSSTVHQIYSQ